MPTKRAPRFASLSWRNGLTGGTAPAQVSPLALLGEQALIRWATHTNTQVWLFNLYIGYYKANGSISAQNGVYNRQRQYKT